MLGTFSGPLTETAGGDRFGDHFKGHLGDRVGDWCKDCFKSRAACIPWPSDLLRFSRYLGYPAV
jgi:hypothetical protein